MTEKATTQTTIAEPDAPFISLRVHSSYSLLESSLRIEDIARLAKKAGMPAVAISDRDNLYGALEFSEALAKQGIQPIIGCSLPVMTDKMVKEKSRRRPPVLPLLAQSETGYRHLMQLSRLAHEPARLAEAGGEPHILLKEVKPLAEGLLCLTGGADGLIITELTGDGGAEEASRLLDLLQEFFPERIFLELQRHGVEAEQQSEAWLIAESETRGLPLVATQEPYFASEDDFGAQDTLSCVGQGVKVDMANRRRLTPEHWFKSGAEMATLFADLPQAVANSGLVARLCHFYPESNAPELPRFSGTPEEEGEALRKNAAEGLRARLQHESFIPSAPEADYLARLETELDVITRMKFAGYFLIVADFVGWAKKQGIPVGPGRGSGAGSLAAWALGITDLDPLRFNLFFERFLNPERISMPDFDIDFCQERRDEVIAYVRQRYGEDRVASIITFGSLHARAAMRDAGRALGIPYGYVDKLCKLVPNDPANPIKLEDAIKNEEALQKARDEDPDIANLLRTSSQIEGLYRHASTHAAGVVIGREPLEQRIPLTYDPRSGGVMTQFSMKWVENAGLVKFDFLGLKTLTALQLTLNLLRQKGETVALESIPLDDPKIYELLSSGETGGLFQMESNGVRDTLRQMRPDRFEDIIALVALYRPGPMANIPRYIKRKRGDEKPDYLHPSLEGVLKETFGVIIYQEQVMQIAQILADYTPGEADILRRAMGKKIAKEMRDQKQRFVEGAEKKDIPRAKATQIFDLVDRFAGYGFNKSHAAAYALLAVQTAWLKAHHPVEFLAAQMTLDINTPEKISQLRQEARRMGVEVAPPDINHSSALFSVSKGKIIYALAAIRNIGRGAAEAIVKAREAGEPFTSLDEFTRRVPQQHLNKRVFENLASTGVFDQMTPNRNLLVTHAEAILRAGGHAQQQEGMGQEALFAGETNLDLVASLPQTPPWNKTEMLEKEFEAAGLYLSGHPLEDYEEGLKQGKFRTAASLVNARGGEQFWLAGVITQVQKRRSRRGNAFAYISISDPTGGYEVLLFADTLSQAGELAEAGRLVGVEVESERQNNDEGAGGGDLRLRAQQLLPLEKALARRGRPMSTVPITASAPEPYPAPTPAPQAENDKILRVFLNSGARPDALKPYFCAQKDQPANSAVHLVVPDGEQGRFVEIALPPSFSLTPEGAERLEQLPEVRRVERG